MKTISAPLLKSCPTHSIESARLTRYTLHMAALTISKVSKSFGPQSVLSEISLEISSGEFFFILGPSGCGKSTLLRIIAGLERADGGTIAIDGAVVNSVPPQKRGIGMVFQHYALWPHMTVAQNVRFGLEVQRLSQDEQRLRMNDALEAVRMLGFEHRYPHELSGGQQQRVALARALALQPRVILMDEPLSNLDARLRDEIRAELLALHRELKLTIIYVTHDQEDALALATRMAILNAGQLVQLGTPQELYRHPSSPFAARFLGEANLLAVAIGETNGRGLGVATLVDEVGITVQIATLPSAPSSGLLCVRPESIQIYKPDQVASIGGIKAKVTRVTYHGSYEDFELLVGSSTHIKGRAMGAGRSNGLATGDQVSIGWEPSEATLISDVK